MFNYLHFSSKFGSYLYDDAFQAFLAETFTDITRYNILDGDYISSELLGLELVFTNDDAVTDEDELIVLEPGRPVFSHINIYPKTNEDYVLPFDVLFSDSRETVFEKAGEPTQTKQAFFN
jgi:hypothetical protein